MPVIVVGADTEIGAAVTAALLQRDGEVRAFVTDRQAAESLRSQKVKVAVGDVSDASHIGAAATRCFTAILIESAAVDDRERSFQASLEGVRDAWIGAVGEAAVRRLIWIGSHPPSEVPNEEYACIDPEGSAPAEVAAEAAAIDELAQL